MSCPICEKRKAKRFCPAKGEKICAVCCGQEREVTIDCPGDCAYLVAARRYEAEHREPVPAEEVPYPDAEISAEMVHERRGVVAGLGSTILGLTAEQPSLTDADVATAVGALAETYRTLGSGIYYERPPEAALPRLLYEGLAQWLQEFKKQEAERAGFSTLKDAEIFHLLAFLLRVERNRRNGRPRSRAFLDFLRSQFPGAAEAAKSEPRIIVP